jgi:hypothetical protein
VTGLKKPFMLEALMKNENNDSNASFDLNTTLFPFSELKAQDKSSLPDTYFALKKSSPQEVAAVLPTLTQRERQVLLDIDSWKKDQFDPYPLFFWMETYRSSENEKLKKQFLTSPNFLLFLKSQFTVSVFDVEEPDYPEHDQFFVTDDSQLLFEYKPEFLFADEVQASIRDLYFLLGVDASYSLLFKMVSESYIMFEEVEFEAYKHRIQDFGLVDYYQALEMLAPMNSMAQIQALIKKRLSATTAGKEAIEVSSNSSDSVLTSASPSTLALASASTLNSLASISSDLASSNIDPKRAEFLRSNYAFTLNANIMLQQKFHSAGSDEGLMSSLDSDGPNSMLRSLMQEQNTAIALAVSFIAQSEAIAETSVITHFTYTDLYRLGVSLVRIAQNKLAQVLKRHRFETTQKITFLGDYWDQFIHASAATPPKLVVQTATLEELPIDQFANYQSWQGQIEMLSRLFPYIEAFYQTYSKLVEDQKIQDRFYLNYDTSNINFESILITSFANFSLGHLNSEKPKLGLTKAEALVFLKSVTTPEKSQGKPQSKSQDQSEESSGRYHLRPTEELRPELTRFIDTFGLNLPEMVDYFYDLLSFHISGVQLDDIQDEEWKFMGGPIVLNA